MPLFNPSITPAELAAIQQVNGSQESAIATLQQSLASLSAGVTEQDATNVSQGADIATLQQTLDAQASLNLAQANAIATLQQQVATLTAPVQWQNLPFAGSWRDYGSSHQPARYCKDVFGVVRLTGLVAAGIAGSTIAILPTGFRPAARLVFGSLTNTGVGRVDVASEGLISHVSGGTSWVSLDGISFWVG